MTWCSTILDTATEEGNGLTRQCEEGWAAGYEPTLAEGGLGGSYFFRDGAGEVVAVFKPIDEEPFAPNNPRGYVGLLGSAGMRTGIRSGEAARRELAAYVLDNCILPSGPFAGVPHTFMAQLDLRRGQEHVSKVGSMQAFVASRDIVSDLSPSLFAAADVHRIGILDVLTVNTDRNDGNILVCDGPQGLHLVPIDHGYCFPEVLEVGWCDWVWLSWAQCQTPFEPQLVEQVVQLCIDDVIEALKEAGIVLREACLFNLKCTLLLLQKGMQAGMTLAEIAALVVRDELDSSSTLERCILHARHRSRLKARRLPKALSFSSFSLFQGESPLPEHAIQRPSQEEIDCENRVLQDLDGLLDDVLQGVDVTDIVLDGTCNQSQVNPPLLGSSHVDSHEL